jgi:hypothetical protein
MDGSFQCHGEDECHIELHYGIIGIYKDNRMRIISLLSLVSCLLSLVSCLSYLRVELLTPRHALPPVRLYLPP